MVISFFMLINCSYIYIYTPLKLRPYRNDGTSKIAMLKVIHIHLLSSEKCS